jgi:hypothetical protein
MPYSPPARRSELAVVHIHHRGPGPLDGAGNANRVPIRAGGYEGVTPLPPGTQEVAKGQTDGGKAQFRFHAEWVALGRLGKRFGFFGGFECIMEVDSRLSIEGVFQSDLVCLELLHVGEAHEAEGDHAAFEEFGKDAEEGADGHFAADVSGRSPSYDTKTAGARRIRHESYTCTKDWVIIRSRRRSITVIFGGRCTRAGLGWPS